MSKKQKIKKGFTIIEVVLVLAVAGLIFLMVFVALPALQRNQRDTQRRQDYGDLSSAISGYMASNGKLPATNTSLASNKYINENGQDPERNEYVITVCESTNGTQAKCGSSNSPVDFSANSGDPKQVGATGKGNQVYVVTRADCSGTNSNSSAAPKYKNSGRAFAIYGFMESTGTYCQASS